MMLFLTGLWMLLDLAVAGSIHTVNLPGKNLTLCFLGDTGTGSKVQEKVARSLKEEKCHSIHFLGDLIYPSGLSSANDPQFNTKFLNFYETLTKEDFKPRLHLIMGNHDYRGNTDAWLEFARKKENIFFPSPYYLLKINDLCLLNLESNYFKLFTKFIHAIKEVWWLGKIEKELSGCPVTIVLAHHPYKSRGAHGDSSGLYRWFLNWKIIGHFDYLISGHDHLLSDEGIVEGTKLLVSGAGGSPDRNEMAGYLVVKWNQELRKLNYEFKKISPE